MSPSTTSNTGGSVAHTRTMAGEWSIFRADGEPIGEFSFMGGGSADVPDWDPVDDPWDAPDEPTEFIAERFVHRDGDLITVVVPASDGGDALTVVDAFLRQAVIRWCGGVAHEWDDLSPADEAGTLVGCISCGIRRSDIGSVSAPWDEKCEGDPLANIEREIATLERLGDPDE